MIALIAIGALFVLACSIMAVALGNGAGASPPGRSPGSPVAMEPSTTAAPGTPGSKLPASCKITGDVFGPNARVKNGIRRENVRATYHYYSPAYNTSSLACADIVWKWPNSSQKLLMYPWTAYCLDGSQNWNPQRTCGRCLRVRNRGTGAAIIVRAVDSGGCSGGSQNGLDLDPCAFNAIDSNKHGVRDGHMMVDVEEVEC